MLCYFLQGLGQKLLIFFVARDDKGVVDLWVELMRQGLFEFPFFLDLLGLLHDPPGLAEGDDADDDNNRRLEGEIDEHEDAEFLIDDLEPEGAKEHGDPADDIEGGDDDFVLVIVLEILEIHAVEIISINKKYCCSKYLDL